MQHCVGSPQQFCLRWNNYQSNLTNVFDQLLQSESFVDVTLACDGHSVKAHKMVLSACSPYFQSLFFENPCQHPIVILKDIRWPELKAAVEFMYKGEINVSQEQIGPLLKVAESLKIRGLADVNNDEVSGSSSSTSGTPGSGVGAGGGPGGGGPSGPGSGGGGSSSNSGGAGSGIATPTLDSKKNWEPRQGPTPQDLSLETAMTPSPSSQSHGRQKKRRRTSGERSSSSSPNDSMVEGLETSALELCSPPHAGGTPLQPPAPPSSAGSASSQPLSTHQTQVTAQGLPPPPQTHPHGPTLVPIPGDPGLMLPPMAHPDDMEIKPGIAEMIREEERAKLLESSHAWLGASTSSIADYPALLKLKAPTWTQAQLKEAIHAVVTQKMRFTQASASYGIPKGTLYDNILGKSKRMVVLEEAGLTPVEEHSVLDFCCEVSVQPYNRRTKKSLPIILTFVEKLRRNRDPEFKFSGLAGFRWWWAFCKKHSIVSLYFDRGENRFEKRTKKKDKDKVTSVAVAGVLANNNGLTTRTIMGNGRNAGKVHLNF